MRLPVGGVCVFVSAEGEAFAPRTRRSGALRGGGVWPAPLSDEAPPPPPPPLAGALPARRPQRPRAATRRSIGEERLPPCHEEEPACRRDLSRSPKPRRRLRLGHEARDTSARNAPRGRHARHKPRLEARTGSSGRRRRFSTTHSCEVAARQRGLRCRKAPGRAGLGRARSTARLGLCLRCAHGGPNERRPAGQRPPSEGGRPQDSGGEGGARGGSGSGGLQQLRVRR